MEIINRGDFMPYTILITVNILILIIIAWRATIKRPEIKQMVCLSDDDLVRALLPFAREMRITEYGKGYNLASLYPVIHRAYKLIEAKVKKNKVLFEYEKWLYQNIYLVKRFIFSKQKNSFKNLPHSNGEVRITALARFIVNRSLNCLNSQRISLALNTIKNQLSLSFSEILLFNDAISYAAIEQIYILCQRILFHSKCARLSRKGMIIKRKMVSDVYNYFLLNNPKLKEEAERQLRRMGINPQSIAFNYNLSLTHSTKMAESLFKALLNYNDYLPKDERLEYHNVTSILKEQKEYDKMSMNTKYSFFRIIEKISEKLNISEMVVAKALVEMADKNNTDIATILYDHYYTLKRAVKTGQTLAIPTKRSNKRECWYIISIITTTLAFGAGGWLWTGSVVAALLSLVPIFFIVEFLINTILSHLVEQKTLPQMNYQKIPPEHNTMVVISEFLTSVEQADEAIKHLLEVKEGNDCENIQFSLLVDLKKCDSETLGEDKAIIDKLSELLKYDRCNVFVRKRVKDGDKYIGYERKRGAIMALNRYLVTGDDKEFSFILRKEYPKPEYIMTLDADNTVNTSGIRDMINIIAHPYNEKYDLINAHSRYNLFSIRTGFSKRFLFNAGIIGYPVYSSLYYNLFGKDVFCGKGIYKVKSFYNKLEGVFPSKKILSHDILEGALLNTGCGGTIYEDAPTGFLSERERRKRWMRGDIQLLPFIGRSWKNDEGRKYISKMSPFYKFLIFHNAIHPLREFFLLILALSAVFLSAGIWKWFFLVLAFPYIINQIGIFQGVNNNIRFRYIVEKTALNIKNLIEEVFMLTYYGIANLILFVKTLMKMASKGNLLEWKTYYQAQKQKSFYSYIREFTVSIVFLTVLGGIMFFVGLNPVFLLAFGVWAYLAQLSLYWGNREFKEYRLTREQKEKLINYAEKTYKYFNLMQTPSGIIGDNMQIKPYKGQSKNTSPTNIGFSMLADVSAYYLGFIDLQKCIDALFNKIKSVDIMPKWHGNLYNWYKIDTYRPINNFISSVDSGNFLACLMIVNEFFKDKNFQKGVEIAERIIEDTDLDRLYDFRKGLFYIGFNEKSGEYTGHYDILASEARILSMIYIARSGKAEHWRNLQRDYTPLMGNTLLSWSGTMFEYLMADLFIDSPRFSLLHESSYKAATIQSRSAVKGIWGVSESCYYEFDDELRYQYYAFGLKKLSLRSDFDRSTVSPYSSILALKYIPNEVMENLSKIEEMGGFHDYGFYEAIDLSGRTRFIASYMTHHQGMILAAITNALNDDVLCKLFRKAKGMRACMNLLNERTSEQTFAIKQKTQNNKILKMDNEYYEYISEIEFNTKSAILSNGAMTVCFDTLGNNFVKYNDMFINAYRRIYETHNGGYFYVVDYNGNIFSPSYFPLCEDKSKFSVSYSDVEMTFENTHLRLKQDIAVADGLNAEVRRLSLKNDMPVKKVAYYMDVALNTYDGFNAHPVFNNLFIHTSFDESNKAVIFHKRSMQKEGDVYLAFVIRGLRNLKIETNRFNLLGRNGSEKNPLFLKDEQEEKLYPSLGDVLEPAVGIVGEFEDEKKECQIITIIAESMEELEDYIRILPDDFYSYCKESSRMKYRIGNLANRLCGPLLYQPYPNKTLLYVWKNRLQNQFDFITNRKKTILYLYDDSKNNFFIELLKAFRQWKYLGLDLRLIVYYSENFKETQKDHITELLKRYFVTNYMLVEKSQKIEYLFDFAFLVLDTELSVYELKERDNIIRNIQDSQAYLRDFEMDDREQSSLKSGAGYYCQESYILYDRPLLPYSNVICDKYGGMVITENGGGFYFFENSREFKATRHDFDPVKDTPFEYLFLKSKENYHRINGGSGKGHMTIYQKGMNIHKTLLTDFDIEVANYIINEGMGRVCETNIMPVSAEHTGVELIYAFYPNLSWTVKSDFIAIELNHNTLSIYNLLNGKSFYLKLFGLKNGTIQNVNFNAQQVPYFEITLSSLPQKLFFVASKDYVFLNSLDENSILEYKEKDLRKYSEISNINIKSPVKSFNYFANNLLYQVYSSRLRGKCGYYQTGGATGFRDQLQDCMAFLHSNPEITREQIIYSAGRQYEEGDVMHWWHHPKFGLRTKITDDKLYLPYAVCEYIEFTDDKNILDVEIPYLKSPVLEDYEKTRLEDPPYTTYTEPIRGHCIRAIKSALKFGEHNILLLGGGDWNDGLDHAGIDGRGESVALSMLCYDVLMRFKEYCDKKTKEFFNETAEKLKKNIDEYCFEDGQYKRLFTDEGKWYGASNTSEYNIDLVAQSFATLYNIADERKRISCLNAAKQLVNEKLGIIKLLSPPLTKKTYLGYISSYPKGIRENGGQYTHSAIWYIMALIRAGKQEEAFELFQMINPTEKCRFADNNQMYKGEPYVLAADVYYNSDNKGRAGWTWYTGSAAWAYRLIVEEFFGLKRNGDKLVILPNLPKKLINSEILYKYNISEYIIEYVQGEKNRLTVDGVKKGGFEVRLENKKRSKIVVEIAFEEEF